MMFEMETNGRPRPGNPPVPQTRVETDLVFERELFDDNGDGDGALAQPEAAPQSEGATSSTVAAMLRECCDKLTAVDTTLATRQADEDATRKLQQGYQALLEQFHEREVLRPVFLQLIAIADRCRQKVSKLEAFLDKHQTDVDGAKREMVRYVASARHVDLVEIENILANFGVTPFEHPDKAFDQGQQTCVSRTPCQQKELVGLIAQRLRPGYRRNAQVIRPEYVAVYVASPNGPQP